MEDKAGNISEDTYTVTLLPEGAAPAKPSEFAAAAGNTLATLTWNDPSNNTITKYQYQQRHGNELWSNWTDICETSSDSTCPTETSHVITGLTNDTRYFFRIRAVNAGGTSPESDEKDAKPGVLPAPSGLAATGAASQIDLSWTASGNNSVIGYQVRQRLGSLAAIPGNGKVELLWDNPNDSSITGWQYRYKTGTNDYNDWSSVPNSNASTTAVTVGSLANGTAHTFQVQPVRGSTPGAALDTATATPSTTASDGWTDVTIALTASSASLTFTSGQSGNWNTAQTATVKLTAAPTSDVKIALRHDNVEFTPSTMTFTTDNWNTAQNVSVKLKAAPAANTTVSLATALWANAASHAVTSGVTSGNVYGFQIRALDAVSPGLASGWVPSALLPAKPAGLSATPGDKNVTLSWTDPANPTIYKWQYQQGSDDWTDAADAVTLGADSLTFTPTIGATLGAPSLTFTTQNWNVQQTFTVQLAAAPTGTTTVSFNLPNVEFSPAKLTFTTQNWNTTQNVKVRLKTQPQAETKISMAVAHSVNSPQRWNVHQTVSVKLAAAPTGITHVSFKAPNAEFLPAKLTFTPQNWNTTQNVRVRLNTAPQANTSVDVSSAYSIPWGGATTLTWSGGTSVIVTGLNNDTDYTFKVRAVNAGGIGPESDGAAATPKDKPGAPTGFTAAPKPASVDLSWTDPNDASITAYEYRQTQPANGLTAFGNSSSVELSWSAPSDTSEIDWWQYRYRASGGTYGGWWKVPNGASATGHTVGNLGNGTAYDFQVRAAVDSSTAGGLTAYSDYRSVALAWSSPSNVSSIHKWQYSYKTNGAYGAWTEICRAEGEQDDVDRCQKRTSTSIVNLTGGVEHTFKIRAVDSSDDPVGSVLGEVTATTLASRLPSLGPVRATPTAAGGWTAITDSSATTVAHTVTSLTNETLYTFQLRARRSNAIGPASGNASATPVALPAKPTGLTATSGENEAVTLSWPTSNIANSWSYSSDNGATWTTITTATPVVGTNRTYRVTGLTNGTAYTFKLRGLNRNAQAGPASDEATATPRLLPAPTGLTASPLDARINLSWTDPSDSTIVRYEYQVTLKDTAPSAGGWATVPGSGATTVAHNVTTGLVNGTEYDYHLRAVSAVQTSAAAKVSATPIAALAAPTSVTGAAKDAAYATFTWSHPNTSLIEKFQTRYRKGSNAWTSWADAPKTQTSYSIYEAASVSNLDQSTYTLPMTFNPSLSWAQEFTTGSAAGGYTLSSVTLDFESVTNASGVEAAIYSKANGSVGASIGAALSGTAAVGQVTFTCDSGCTLAAKTSYYVRVSATGQSGGKLNNTGSGSETPVPGDNGWSLADRAIQQSDGFGPFSNSANAMKLKLNAVTPSAAGIMDYGTVYTFEVRAVNSANPNGASPSAQATAATAPAKPTGLTATGAYREATLAWSDPGYPSIGSWRYQQVNSVNGLAAFSGGDSVHLAWSAPSSTTGISKWQYRYKPASPSEDGYTGWTDVTGSSASTTSATVDRVRVGPPTFFQVRAVNSSNALVGSVLGEAAAAHWPTSWTAISESDASTTSHTVTGLTDNTAYAFRIRAVNAAGVGLLSDAVSVTTNDPRPPAPTGLILTAGNAEATLTWNKVAYLYSITGYEYRYKTTGDYPQTWTAVSPSGRDTIYHKVTGLTNEVEHTFQLRAVNAHGAGPASNGVAVTPTIGASKPAAPTGLTATPGDGQVTLTWTNPNNSSITKWQYSTDGSNWTDICVTSSNTGCPSVTTTTVTNLTNGTSYTFRLRAVNGVGDGFQTVAGATPKAVPAKPTGLTATPGDRQVTLDWTDPGDSTITGWQYKQDTAGPWTDIPNSSASTTSYTVTGLTNGTAYGFRIRAANSSGQGAQSDEASATPNAPPGKPPSLSAGISGTTATLTWTAPSGSTITKWQYRLKQTSGSYGAWTDVPSSTGTTTTYTVPNLTDGIAYTFQVRAVNGAVPGPASDEAGALSTPDKPTGLEAHAGSTTVTLQWDWPNNMSITSWQYAQDTGEWTTMTCTSPCDPRTLIMYKVTGLTNGTSYSFKIRAVNKAGNSSESVPVSATPIAAPGAPTDLTGTGDDGQAALSWKAPSGSTITKWEYRQRAFSANLGGSVWSRWITITPGGANNTLTHTVTQLSNNGVYQFQVRASNSVGAGTPSAAAQVAVVSAKPSAPSNFTAGGGNATATLAWVYPTSPWVYVTKWQYSSDNGTTWADIPANSGGYKVCGRGEDFIYRCEVFETPAQGGNINTRYATITKTSAATPATLSNGKGYSFKIRAVNDKGGTASDDASAAMIPLAPATFTATAGDAQVALAWTKSTSDTTTLTSWQYRYKPKSSAESGYTDWTTAPGGASATSHAVTGLTNGTTYTFQLRAVNATGGGIASSEQTASTALPKPAKPTGLETHAGDKSVTLQWDNPNNSSITSWQYKQDSGNWTTISNSDASTTMHTVTGLTNGTEYSFRVLAVNATGNSDPSDEAKATPIAVPGAPTGLTATGDDRQVALGWTAPSGSVTGWEYRQRTFSASVGGGSWGPWTAVTPGSGANNTLTHTVTQLSNNVVYQFQVRAKNNSGAGTPSAMATAIPVASAPNEPSGFTARGGNATAALAWGYPTSPWVYLAKWQYSSDDGDTWADIPANSGRYRVCGRGEDLIYRCVVTETPAQGGNINTREATITKLSSDTSTNLSNGVVYSFKIRGVNDKGGTASDDASAAMLPLAPAIGSLAVGDEQITLNWTKNSADAAASSWQYRYKPKSSSESGYTGWTAVPGSTASTTSYTVTGLTNGTSYTFQVRGSNSTGTGPASSESSATPAIQPPAKPTGLAAAVGDTEITLTWDNPGNHRITKWQYRYKPKSSTETGYTDWTDVSSSGASTTTYTVTELTNETEYTFEVRAYTTSAGDEFDEVKATPKPVAATPSNFTATVDSSVASQAVKLTWDAQSTATDWEIRYKTTGGYGHWADICDSNCTAGTLATYTFTDLHNNVLYTFQLRAQNNIGWGLPATDSARPLASAPTAPTNLEAAGGNAKIDLDWSYSGVWVDKWQYSTDDGSNWADVASSDKDTRSATITKTSASTPATLSNGTSYTLKVRAVNTKGNGAASAAVTEPTLPLIPASLTASGGDMQVTLSWSKSSSDTTVTGWEYRYKTTGDYGVWTDVPNSTGATTTYTVTGLDNSATYTFQLRAQNAAGVGPSKTSSDASTVPGKPTNPSPMPGQPSGPTATPGTEKVTLRWTNPVRDADQPFLPVQAQEQHRTRLY